MNFRYAKKLLPALFCVMAANPAFACAVCSGASDAPMAQGMNWGIFSLLAVVVGVLGGIAGVGIFFARRAAALGDDQIGN